MSRRFFLITFLLNLSLTSCSGADFKGHFSGQGLIPEAYLPSDLSMVVSYSSLGEAEYAAIQKIETALGDESRVSRTASETFQSEFGEVGLDFERDLRPAFGDQFRMVYGLRAGTENNETFTVLTLDDPKQMSSVLETLAAADQLDVKKLEDFDVYVQESNGSTLMVYEDLLFMAQSGDGILAMAEQNEKESLWGSKNYQNSLAQIGPDFVFYGILYPSQSLNGLSLPAGFSVSDIPAVIEEQIVKVSAEETGFRFEAWVNADKTKAKEVGISFDAVIRSEPYLFNEIPSEGLMAYFESSGLKQTFEEADKLGDDTSTLETLRKNFRSLFAMDFDDDILSFLDQGYALVLHQNGEGIVPGLSVVVDITSNPDGAQRFLDKLDGQLSGYALVFEQSMPGVMKKDTVDWDGEIFNRLSLDLNAIPRNAESPLPAVITASDLQVVYGIRNDRLILSTASEWDHEGESIAESDLYQSLKQESGAFNEGLILVDAEGIGNFLGTLRALREQLGLQVSDAALGFEDFLDGFLGLVAQSKTKAYESHFGGFLMLAD